LLQIEPALTGEPIAHLRQPHRVVGIDERDAGIAPMLDQQRRDDRRNRCSEIGRERIRLPAAL
jgi:hypothetical protein